MMIEASDKQLNQDGVLTTNKGKSIASYQVF